MHTFKVKNTADNQLKIEQSYIVKNYETEGRFIKVWLHDIQLNFIKSGSLTINYLKNQILK